MPRKPDSLANAGKAADASQPNTPVGSPVQQCHKAWISISLARKPDTNRPAWWPKDQNLPYASETFDAVITDGTRSGSLDSKGSVRFDQIPPGSCQITFSMFYNEIENFISSALKK